MPLEWNPVLEDRLKQAQQKAGWRWIGYVLVLVGVATVPVGIVVLDTVSGLEGESPGGVLGVFGFLAAMFLILGLVLALPAEKAAKQARELRVQREAVQTKSE